MGDISTWNPVDNSNTTAPPDGWPEGMAPSAVNNSARAMMGAIRRWYDTVPGQIASAVAAYLPLSGGTLTGNLTAPNVTVSDTVTAAHLTITGNASVAGTVTAPNVTVSDTVTAAHLTITGNANVAGTVTAPNVTASDTVTAAHLTITGNASVAGTVTAAGLTSTGNINAAGTVTGTSFIGNVTVPANGPVTTGGTVTGGQVTSTGNANVAGSMTAGSLHATGNLQVDASATINNTLYVGGPVSFQNTFDVLGGPCSNVDGTWHILSDARLKTEIAGYDTGLDAIQALNPVSYRYRPEVFGEDEARRTHYGLVADEVEPVLPEMVGAATFGDRTVSTLSIGHLNIVLLNACKELAAQNAALAARITALEGLQ